MGVERKRPSLVVVAQRRLKALYFFPPLKQEALELLRPYLDAWLFARASDAAEIARASRGDWWLELQARLPEADAWKVIDAIKQAGKAEAEALKAAEATS